MKLKACDASSSRNKLFISFISRGIAMSSTLKVDEQELLLTAAEKISRSLSSPSIIENIIYQENLYTTLQTLAKNALSKKHFEIAANRFEEMIALDPYDATAYSELALLFLDQEKYAVAALLFEKATLLGPPGMGMNIYYQAKCNEFNDNKTKFLSLLKQAATVDPSAISPWLDLLNHYKSINHREKILEISKKILNKKELSKQLTEEEKKELNTYGN